MKDLCDIIQWLHDNKNAFKSTDPVRFILFLLYFYHYYYYYFYYQNYY